MRLIPRDSRREKWFTRLGGFLLYATLKLIGGTIRQRVVQDAGLHARFAAGDQIIFAFWHGQMVTMPSAYKGRGACILVSQHRDGALISRAIESLGIEVVHGSSTRGWVKGLKGMLAAAQRGCDLVVVPDGPRGPRCRAKPGVLQLARATGLPIYPVSSASRRQVRFSRSWDWLGIPLPWSAVTYAVGEPLKVSRQATAEELEAARVELERRLNEATQRAGEALGIASEMTDDYINGGVEGRRFGENKR